MKRIFPVAVMILTVFTAFALGAKEDESFSYMGIDRMEVNAVFLDVEVSGDEGFSVSLRSDLPESTLFQPRNFTVKHEVIGSSLRVWVEQDSIFSHGEGTLFFHVPRGTRLSVETASGNVRIADSKSDELKAKSVSGHLLLSDIEAPVEAESVSGNLEVRRLRGDAVLSTTSGRIEMIDLEGRVSAISVSGAIQGDHVTLTEDSLFKSVSGDIKIGLRNALDALRYDLSTVSGGLTVGSVRASRGLQMGNGNPTLRGETVSGSQIYQ